MKRKRYSNELKSKVALTAIKGDRTVNEIASEYGIHVSQVNRWKKEAIEMLPDLFGNKVARKSKDIEKEKKSTLPADRQAAGRSGVSKKKHGTLALSVSEKRDSVEKNHTNLSIQRQCDLLGLCRSSFYRNSQIEGRESLENLKLIRIIDKEYTGHPFYGSRQMRNVLRRQGYKINRKRVQRLMRRMGLQSVAPKPGTSKSHSGHKVFPYLLRNLIIDHPDQVRCTDITYIRMAGGFVYLTAVMDWYSRFVLSWEVSVTMDTEFCVSALERSLRLYGTPEIFNTDQGAQYTSKELTGILHDNGVKISVDGKGRAMDNIMIERLWRTVKYEEIYLKEYNNVSELKTALKKYFHFYNYERPHTSLGGKSPVDIYLPINKIARAA